MKKILLMMILITLNVHALCTITTNSDGSKSVDIDGKYYVWSGLSSREKAYCLKDYTPRKIEIEKLKEWQKVTKYVAGDIAVFRVGGFSCHVGMVINAKEFIHILSGSEVTIEKFDSIVWNKRLDGVYRKCKQL